MLLQHLPAEILERVTLHLSTDGRCNLATAMPSVYDFTTNLVFYENFKPLGKRSADGQRRSNETQLRLLNIVLDRIADNTCTSITLLSHAQSLGIDILAGALDQSSRLKSFSTNQRLPQLAQILPRLNNLEHLMISPDEDIDFSAMPKLRSLTLKLRRNQELELRNLDALEDFTLINPSSRSLLDYTSLPRLRKLHVHSSTPFYKTAVLRSIGSSTSVEHLIMTGRTHWDYADNLSIAISRPTEVNSKLKAFSACGLKIPAFVSQVLPHPNIFARMQSIEWYDMPLTFLTNYRLPELRKLVIHTPKLITAGEMDKLATAVGSSLEMLVISASQSDSWTVFSDVFVLLLLRSLRLKYLSVTGRYYFTREHWLVLCERAFDSLEVLHIEQSRCGELDDQIPDHIYENLELVTHPNTFPVQGCRVFVKQSITRDWWTGESLTVADIRKKIFDLADPESYLALSRGHTVTDWRINSTTDRVFAVRPHNEDTIQLSTSSPTISLLSDDEE